MKGEELTLSGRRLRHDMVLAVSHADALKVSHRRQPGQHRLPWGSSAPPPALGECGASCGCGRSGSLELEASNSNICRPFRSCACLARRPPRPFSPQAVGAPTMEAAAEWLKVAEARARQGDAAILLPGRGLSWPGAEWPGGSRSEAVVAGIGCSDVQAARAPLPSPCCSSSLARKEEAHGAELPSCAQACCSDLAGNGKRPRPRPRTSLRERKAPARRQA